MKWFAAWWHHAVPYEELKAHLRGRGLETPIRSVVSGISAVLCLAAIGTVPTATGPRGPGATALILGASLGAGVCAIVWVRSWPTRRQSIGYLFMASTSISAAAFAQSDPIVGLLACTVFAALAGYVALFHSPALLTANFVVAAATATVQAVRLWHTSHTLAAACGLAVVIVLNLVVPAGTQFLVHGLGADALVAERDPLTGLLTRHAFRRRVLTCCELHRPGDHLTVMMVDLDQFKALNDRRGHPAGDRALVAVARAMQAVLSDGAVIGRAGGEEFQIAGCWQPDQITPRADLLRIAIAALDWGVTASIGVTDTAMDGRPGDDLIGRLIETADRAMYVAKRAGGNRWHHTPWPTPRDGGDVGVRTGA